MSTGFKGLAKIESSHDFIEAVFSHADNPFVALTAGVLATVMAQSSSFTTSLIIMFVFTGQLSFDAGVFAIMGANIGTSVTSTIASLGSLRIERQFRRAFSAAIVHDIFNLLTVAVLFPLEWSTGIVRNSTLYLAQSLGLSEIEKATNPVKVITRPIVDGMVQLLEWVNLGKMGVGIALAGVGLVLLLFSLAMLVTNLKGALLNRIEGLFSKVFFRNDLIAYCTGAITTVMVQSSSITTSLIVPLAGAGAVRLQRVFPYVLGANLGTTVTGLIAATANPQVEAVAVAFAHVMFNVLGSAIWYPLRRIPIAIAQRYGRLAAKRKSYALLYLFVVFVLIPAIGLIITELIL
ncbi:MAG: Na/Pi symporter [Phycisphaerales bacterium]|nr:Na/Pi symporter [Phycisphaerales bacterium]